MLTLHALQTPPRIIATIRVLQAQLRVGGFFKSSFGYQVNMSKGSKDAAPINVQLWLRPVLTRFMEDLGDFVAVNACAWRA